MLGYKDQQVQTIGFNFGKIAFCTKKELVNAAVEKGLYKTKTSAQRTRFSKLQEKLRNHITKEFLARGIVFARVHNDSSFLCVFPTFTPDGPCSWEAELWAPRSVYAGHTRFAFCTFDKKHLPTHLRDE